MRPELYKGTVHRDLFAWAVSESRIPLCYNGDLLTVEDITAVERDFPTVEAVMVGRGAVADPALLRKLRGGPAATRQEVEEFTGELYQAYQDFYGQPGHAAQRMKEVWFYLIHLFEGGEKHAKQMRRLHTPRDYEALAAAIFQELPLPGPRRGPLCLKTGGAGNALAKILPDKKTGGPWNKVCLFPFFRGLTQNLPGGGQNFQRLSPMSSLRTRSTVPGRSVTTISQVALMTARFRCPPNTRP